jgi:hypothetical protein
MDQDMDLELKGNEKTYEARIKNPFMKKDHLPQNSNLNFFDDQFDQINHSKRV